MSDLTCGCSDTKKCVVHQENKMSEEIRLTNVETAISRRDKKIEQLQSALAEKDAEIEELKAENNKFRKECFAYDMHDDVYDCCPIMAEKLKAEADFGDAREALKRYGFHSANCQFLYGDCNCGYQQALNKE